MKEFSFVYEEPKKKQITLWGKLNQIAYFKDQLNQSIDTRREKLVWKVSSA
jgi:hypothetical protein